MLKQKKKSPLTPVARIPKPEPGLIFRYGYVWLREHKEGKENASKDRPACILLQLQSNTNRRNNEKTQTQVNDGDVIILPITTQPPDSDMFSVELSVEDKERCGLDPETPSWIIVSEYNTDQWPNADLRAVPGTGEFYYGVAPPGLMKRIREQFKKAREAKKTFGFKRPS